MDIETTVKLHVYDAVAATARMPRVAEIAAHLGMRQDEVRDAFRGLRQKRLLALEPADGEILMAPPFSAVPTQHRTLIGGRAYFANCIWDAFGIAAALHADADIETECGDCGESIGFAVRGGAPEPADAVMHYAVPAAKWWDDIVYT